LTNLQTFFHSQNQEKIGNNTITKDPTAPQVCHYSASSSSKADTLNM